MYEEEKALLARCSPPISMVESEKVKVPFVSVDNLESIVTFSIKASPEAVERAVNNLLAKRLKMVGEVLDALKAHAVAIVKDQKTKGEKFEAFWKRLFCQTGYSPAMDNSKFVRETIESVFRKGADIKPVDFKMYLMFFYQNVEMAHRGGFVTRFPITLSEKEINHEMDLAFKHVDHLIIYSVN